MIQFTQRAASHVQHMLNKRGHGMGFRLATRQAGCSGFLYEVNYVDQVNDDDVVFESYDIKIVIDKNSLPNINGTKIDYLEIDSMNQGFEFHNPNAQDVCGCGESFKVEQSKTHNGRNT